MKIKITLGMLFLMIFLPLCKNEIPTYPVSGPMIIHIEGVVKDAITNNPLSDVNIRLVWGGYTPGVYTWTLTDKEGRYSITYRFEKGCSHTYFCLLAGEKEGYGGGNFGISGGLPCTEELQIINFQLMPRDW